LHTVFALIIALGLRRGEALDLRWEHLNLERRTLRVVETLTEVDLSLYCVTDVQAVVIRPDNIAAMVRSLSGSSRKSA
jgi:integrase